MRIATFNLENLDLTSNEDVTLADRAEVLRPQLQRLDADILCLQEVNGQHRKGEQRRSLAALDALLEGTRYAIFNRAATVGPNGTDPADVHNLVILSRWPILSRAEFRNTLAPPLSYRMLTANPPEQSAVAVRFDRSILHCIVRSSNGEPLDILNVHLRSPLATAIPGQKEAPFVWKSISGWAEGSYLSALKRSGQALEARLVIDELFDGDPHRRVAVAGDFNSEDHETPLKVLIGAEDDTGNGRLAPRSLAVLDRSLANDRRFSVLHHGRPEMLDHILVSRTLLARFRGIEVHNETLVDELAGYAKTHHAAGSYHAPIVAEFSDD